MRNAQTLLGETNCPLLLNHCQQLYRPCLIMLSLSALHLSAPSECREVLFTQISKRVTGVAVDDIPRNVRRTSRTNPQLYQLDAQHSDGLLSLPVIRTVPWKAIAFCCKGSELLPEKCLAALTHSAGMSALFHISLLSPSLSIPRFLCPLPPSSFFFREAKVLLADSASKSPNCLFH